MLSLKFSFNIFQYLVKLKVQFQYISINLVLNKLINLQTSKLIISQLRVIKLKFLFSLV